MHFSKIVGDLIQGYSLKAAATVTACIIAHEVYGHLVQTLAPVSQVLGH